jgi:hypothetical protein
MYHSTFTEFSFGYALTDNIMHSGLPATPTVPVFPSLIAEGSAGGGYDVKIPLYPVPIFLQFKIPQVVRRRTIKMPPSFNKPYLRMHLRTKRPNQHSLLCDLEASGKLVAYATPDFWQISELDRYFTALEVPLRTRYFSPSRIGPLDDKPHEVAYCPGNPATWLFSEPEKLDGKFDSEAFGVQIVAAIRSALQQEPMVFLNHLIETITQVAKSTRTRGSLIVPIAEIQKRETVPIKGEGSEFALAAREAAYLAQVRLGCTLVITGRNQ